MQRRAITLTFSLFAAALALSACTASPYIPEQKFAEASEARLVVVTGSRIPQMVDMSDRNPRTMTPTSIITMDDIEKTGEISLCRALRRKMPNMLRPIPGTLPRGGMVMDRC